MPPNWYCGKKFPTSRIQNPSPNPPAACSSKTSHLLVVKILQRHILCLQIIAFRRQWPWHEHYSQLWGNTCSPWGRHRSPGMQRRRWWSPPDTADSWGQRGTPQSSWRSSPLVPGCRCPLPSWRCPPTATVPCRKWLSLLFKVRAAHCHHGNAHQLKQCQAGNDCLCFSRSNRAAHRHHGGACQLKQCQAGNDCPCCSRSNRADTSAKEESLLLTTVAVLL